VKGRRGTAFGHPAEAVTREKQRRLFRSAETYLMRRRLGDVNCRFDVVTILGADSNPKVSILRDAFRGPPSARSRR
jgi:putative endonuclease